MSRKVPIIFIALLAILLVANWHLFGTSAGGRLIDWLLILILVSRAYRMFQKTDRVPVPANLRPNQTRLVQTPLKPWSASGNPARPGRRNTTGQLSIVALIVLFVFLFAAYRVVGAGALNFFVWGDHILASGNAPWPVVMWAVAGLLFGAVVGSIVIWRKYHIKFQWCLVTLVPFLIVLVGLHALSDPLRGIQPPPLIAVADSMTHTLPLIERPTPVRKDKKPVVLKPTVTAKTPKEAVATANSCAKDQAVVTINARSDSVQVYYRVAPYQDGPWSSWRSKFIPQQGQFSLTDSKPVSANRLQYYYEIKSVLTRSAQNPYNRQLCEGQLVIDTY